MSRRDLVIVVIGAHISVLTLAVIFGGCVKGKKAPRLTSAAPVRELSAPDAIPESILDPSGMVEETDLLVSREPEAIPPKAHTIPMPSPAATSVFEGERRAEIAERKEAVITGLAEKKEKELTVAVEKREKKIELAAAGKEKNLTGPAEKKERGPVVPKIKRREAVSPAAAMKHRRKGGTHKVAPGDSLWKISRLYDISVVELAEANGMKKDSVIRVGQVLVIPGPDATPASKKEEKNTKKPVENTPTAAVEAAEEIPVAAVEAAEEIPVAAVEATEETPVAVVEATEETPVAAVEATEETPVAAVEATEETPVAAVEAAEEIPEEEAPAQAKAVKTPKKETEEKTQAPGVMKTHVIQRGETLSSIAKRYGVSLKKLVEVNKIENPGKIRAGQSLVIPQ